MLTAWYSVYQLPLELMLKQIFHACLWGMHSMCSLVVAKTAKRSKNLNKSIAAAKISCDQLIIGPFIQAKISRGLNRPRLK